MIRTYPKQNSLTLKSARPIRDNNVKDMIDFVTYRPSLRVMIVQKVAK